MGRISGLSHVGVFVKDLDKMTQFYCDTLGLTVSHRNEDRMVFLTADITREDHEVVLVRGRDGDAKIIQQLSFRVGSVEDVRAFHQTFQRLEVPIQQVEMSDVDDVKPGYAACLVTLRRELASLERFPTSS